MWYVWIKALHVAAALIWVGGLTVLLVAAKAVFSDSGKSASMPFLNDVLRWNRRVTSPAMLLLWGLGIVLASQGGWFASPWLIVKLCVVVILSAVHGILTGKLRRVAQLGGSPIATPALLSYMPAITIIGVLVIAILVITKPG